MKVLLIPEYGEIKGGAYSFFEKIVDINYLNSIQNEVLLETRQILSDMQGVRINRIFRFFSRPYIFRFPYISLFFDFYVTLQVYLVSKPDIIHVSNSTPGLMLGVFILPCPIVFTMHSYPVSQLFTSRFSLALLPLWWYLKLCINSKKTFMTVSHASAKKIHQYMRVPLDRIEVIPNGVPIPEKQSKLENEFVLTVGHVVDYKNPKVWLQVAQKVISVNPKIKFFWIGEGELLERMRTEVNQCQLEENVFFQGAKSGLEEDYLNTAIYFQPSLIESQGIAVLEAMSYGIPCIVSTCGGLPESVIHNLTGYVVPPLNVDEFTKRIIYLIKNLSVRNQMGKAGSKRAREHFSQQNQQNKIINLYQNILQS